MENQPVKKKKSKILPIILGSVILVSVIFGVSRYVYSLHHEDTDDAQIDADISPVLSRVAGFVGKIYFDESMHVHAGDTLLILDDGDLKIRVQQAEASLENAKAGVIVAQSAITTAEAGMQTARATVEASKARAWNSQQDFSRYSNLLKEHAITLQQYEAAKTAKEVGDAQLVSAMKQEASGVAQVQSAQKQVAVAQSLVSQRQADLEYAKLQCSYAVVLSPANGITSRKSVQIGQLVSAGTPLVAIVSESDVYVVANFKETQLEHMESGEVVDIRADAFPDVKLKGVVHSFSAATGAKFSLLPPDNATGNFVKVVQRIPVKILFDEKSTLLAKLRPGMSVKVSVEVK